MVNTHKALTFQICTNSKTNVIYYGRRGKEHLRELKITDCSCTSDGDGHKYIYLDKDEKAHNHQNDENTAVGRMYEVKVTFVIYICTSTMLLHHFDCIFFCNSLFFLEGEGSITQSQRLPDIV
jgi:GH15 family glucan-1,4-alpha-glucosidase